jgi:hypothetical protein
MMSTILIRFVVDQEDVVKQIACIRRHRSHDLTLFSVQWMRICS